MLVFPGQAASLAGPASLIAWAFGALVGPPLAFMFAVLANLAGLRLGARVQIGLAIGGAVILIAAVVIALPRIRSENLAPFATHGNDGIGQPVIVLFFAFAGCEAIETATASPSASSSNTDWGSPPVTLGT